MSVWKDLWPRQGGASPLYTGLLRAATLSAAAGGVVIFGVALTVTLSVIMRNLGMGGVVGDFELVEMSCVFAAGLFLPLCQLHRGHVMVDLFTAWVPQRISNGLDGFWTGLFGIGWLFLSYVMVQGLLEIREYGDRTMLLHLPLWWSFVPGLIGATLSGIIALFQCFMRFDQLQTVVEH